MAITKTGKLGLLKSIGQGVGNFLKGKDVPKKSVGSLFSRDGVKEVGKMATNPWGLGFMALDVGSGQNSLGGAAAGGVGATFGAELGSRALHRFGRVGRLAGMLGGGLAGYSVGSPIGNAVKPGWRRPAPGATQGAGQVQSPQHLPVGQYGRATPAVQYAQQGMPGMPRMVGDPVQRGMQGLQSITPHMPRQTIT